MKKDKKWFVDKWTKERNKTDVHDPMYHFINEFITDVNQLEELEVLSAEWIERNTSPVDDEGRLYIWKRDLENLIIPKQGSSVEEELIMTKLETLTVPTDLGEWLQSMSIGDSGAYFSTIDVLFHYWDTAPDTEVFNFISQNKKELIEVILGTRGYEVEEELKYNVQLKPKSSSGTIGLFLFKLGDEVLVGDNLKAYYPEKDEFRLTELEIKDFDPRYWAFAKPVEEMND